MLQWASRVRFGAYARSGQRALSASRSRPASGLPIPRIGDDHRLAVGSHRPTPERAEAGRRVAGNDPRRARGDALTQREDAANWFKKKARTQVRAFLRLRWLKAYGRPWSTMPA